MLRNKLILRYIFILMAIIIAASFLFVSNNLASDLAKEERQKIQLWADAVTLATSKDESADLDLTLKILSSNKTIPVILCDEDNHVLMSVNLDEVSASDSLAYYDHKISSFKRKNAPIEILSSDFKQYVYYGDSTTLKRLQYYPYIQIGALSIFVFISFLALLSSKKAEQNKVWVGLSKETAHQLGTPISSLLAWIEYLKSKGADANIVDNMSKDIDRLKVVTDRFSKIGSKPAPQVKEIREEIDISLRYLRSRISSKVEFVYNFPDYPLYAQLNESLFSWVIENLIKNAVDAMAGKGRIEITLRHQNELAIIDIADTGKGISKSNFKNVFSPGYTTKERGWGLGLSLVKRIIEEYHKGKIYVKSSEIDKGTTFRIELKEFIKEG